MNAASTATTWQATLGIAGEEMNKVVMVTIVKNEAPYILEWLLFYIELGFRHFVIFDNESSDETARLIDSAKHLANVRTIRWPTNSDLSPQLSAYNEFLQTYKGDFEFAAFLDADEFICPTAGVTVEEFFDSVPPDVGAIALNQRVYGSSGRLSYEPRLVIERFSCCAEVDYAENRFFKTIYRISAISEIVNVHASPLLRGRYVHPNMKDVQHDITYTGTSQFIDYSLFQLNHYILKSKEEFERKRIRGGAASWLTTERAARYDEWFFTAREIEINRSVSNVAEKWISAVIGQIQLLAECPHSNASALAIKRYYKDSLDGFRNPTAGAAL